MFCSNRFRRSCSRAIRSAAVLFALAGYLLAATGMPVPVLPGAASTAKDRSQPFPCMDNPCGCKDALQCWRSCCCTTPAERLAWARKHGVTPPVDLASKGLAASKPPAHSCCAAKHRPAARPCCTAGRDRASCSAADHGCASRQRKCSAQECHEPQTASADASRSSAKSQAQTPAKENIDFVVISAWRQCHGLAPLWSFLGAALSPPTPVGYEFDWQISCWFSLCSESSASADLSPAIPPPRV